MITTYQTKTKDDAAGCKTKVTLLTDKRRELGRFEHDFVDEVQSRESEHLL